MGGEGIVLKNPALAVMLELAYKHPRTGKRTAINRPSASHASSRLS